MLEEKILYLVSILEKYAKPLRGSLNLLVDMIPFKNFFFNFFTRKFKDKVKLYPTKLIGSLLIGMIKLS